MFSRGLLLALAFVAGFACAPSGGTGPYSGSESECYQLDPDETCNDICRCHSCELGAYRGLIYSSQDACEYDTEDAEEYVGACSGQLPEVYEDQWVRCCCDGGAG